MSFHLRGMLLVPYALNVAKGIDYYEEPSNYDEAVNSDGSGKWMIAMYEEMKSLHKNDTWDLMNLSKYKKAVCCKWIFKRRNEFQALRKLDIKSD